MFHLKTFFPAAIPVDLDAMEDFQEQLGPTGQGKVSCLEDNMEQRTDASPMRFNPASIM